MAEFRTKEANMAQSASVPPYGCVAAEICQELSK